MKSLLTALIGAMFVLWPLAGQAEEPCDQTIVDSQGYIKNVGLVTEAADELGGQGAEVRIRVIGNIAGGTSLDTYVAKLRNNTCTSWQQNDGDLRSNLVVMYVATDDRQVGLYMGGQWEKELKREWPRILADMKPKLGGGLQNGDLSLAFASGLRDIASTIKATYAPSAPTQPVVIQTEPTDYSGLWNVLFLLVGAVILAAVVYFILGVLREHQRLRRETEQAQHEAQTVRGQCTALLSEISDLIPILMARANKVGQSFDDNSAAGWKSRVTEIRAKHDRVSAAFAGVRGNPDDKGLKAGAYAAMQNAFGKIHDQLQKIAGEATNFTNELKEAEGLPSSIMEIISATEAGGMRAENAMAEIESQGFTVTDQVTMLSDARLKLTEAKRFMGEKKLHEAKRVGEEALGLVKLAKTKAEALPELKRALKERLAEEQGLVKLAEQTIKSGYKAYLEIEREFAPSSIEPVSGNGSEARKHLKAASASLTTAADRIEKQSWKEADSALNEAEDHLNTMTSLIHSITERQKHLRTARQAAPSEIKAAKADILQARQYLKTHDEDTNDEHFKTLVRAAKLVREAEKMLTNDKPDYLALVRKVDEANKSADKVLAEAQTEHEQAERKRRQAQALLREASSSISAAKEFIEDHQSDVDNKAKSLLTAAKRAFREANEHDRLGQVDSVIRAAGEADRLADQALEQASRNFRDAENEREEERRRVRRRREAATAASYTSSSSSSSSWGGSSGSSSFGGSSSIGGGSRSFGGSSSF